MERMMEPHLSLGFARIVLLVLLPHWTLLCSVQNPKWVSYGEYLGNQACKWQPGCREPQLLPLVSQQLPGTPRMELSCRWDLALQHLFSVANLSGCQRARKECKQEKGNRDLKNIFFYFTDCISSKPEQNVTKKRHQNLMAFFLDSFPKCRKA